MTRSHAARILAEPEVKALIALLDRGGLHICQTLAPLDPEDLDAESGAVAVLHGKVGRAGMREPGPAAIAVLNAWLRVATEPYMGGRSPVFCAARGRMVSSSYALRPLG